MGNIILYSLKVLGISFLFILVTIGFAEADAPWSILTPVVGFFAIKYWLRVLAGVEKKDSDKNSEKLRISFREWIERDEWKDCSEAIEKKEQRPPLISLGFPVWLFENMACRKWGILIIAALDALPFGFLLMVAIDKNSESIFLLVLCSAPFIALFNYLGNKKPRTFALISLIFLTLVFWPIAILYAIFAFFVDYTRYSEVDSDEEAEKNIESLRAAAMNNSNQEVSEKDLDNIDRKLIKEGSFFNRTNQRDGYLWSNAKDVWKAADKKSIYLDNFAFSNDVIRIYGDWHQEDIEMLQKISSRIDPVDLTKTILMVGSMGSGKTEAMNNFVVQDFYQRAFINDVKGDYVEKYYREEIDIILNPFDTRSMYWDIFAEMKYNPEIATAFIRNLVKASVSDKGESDFWTNSASKFITESFLQVAYSDKADKWKALLSKLEKFKEDAGDDKTKNSIALTMDLSVEIFKLIAYRSIDAKPFTISEFFNRQDGQRLFLLNNASYSTKLTPFFTGFLGAVTAVILGRPDSKEDFSLFLLDEFYSLAFDNDTKKKLLTMVRSKGGQLVLGAQFLEERRDKQLMDSSRFAIMIFQLSDGATIKRITDMMGKIEYKVTTTSKTKSTKLSDGILSDGMRNTYNEQIKDKDFISVQKLQSMPQYHHITIIPSKEIIYMGYAGLDDSKKTNNNFDAIDMEKYYKYIYHNLLPGKSSEPKSAIEEEDDILAEEFVHWLKLKFPDDDNAMAQHIRDNNLSSKEIERIFDRFDEDEISLMNAMEKYTEEERSQMLEEFFALPDVEKYSYCKEKQILKALLGFFSFRHGFVIDKKD